MRELLGAKRDSVPEVQLVTWPQVANNAVEALVLLAFGYFLWRCLKDTA